MKKIICDVCKEEKREILRFVAPGKIFGELHYIDICPECLKKLKAEEVKK